jgi:prepilin-type N-terminal cleavage/methylation domain-containing protein/prepilin-type processing-associated H-X9-DG protein
MKPRIEGPRAAGSNSPSPVGFTMIELLTVVAVISVLIALLLPAVQSAREQARRLQCACNLSQLSLAIHNYASSHRVFPPGVVDVKGPIDNRPVGYRMGWTVQVLPFLEQKNIWNQFNFRFGVHDPGNSTARQWSVSTFACPSDVFSTLRSGTSYAGCHHDAEAPIDVDNHGVLFLNSKIKLDDVSDGPAYTILVGEFHRSRSGLGWARGTRAILRNTGHRPNSSDACYQPPSLDPVEVQTDFGSVPLDKVDTSKMDPEEAERALWFVGGFSSHHPNGANFLFCDGTVRFIKQKIDPGIFKALGNRADGLLIGDNQF